MYDPGSELVFESQITACRFKISVFIPSCGKCNNFMDHQLTWMQDRSIVSTMAKLNAWAMKKHQCKIESLSFKGKRIGNNDSPADLGVGRMDTIDAAVVDLQ